jgi:hypothetical protein
MIYWCIALFVMGVMSFLDNIVSYGEVFRWINSVLFMLVSLGILIRTRMMVKTGKIERLIEEVDYYKQEIIRLNRLAKGNEKEIQTVPEEFV